MQIPRRLLVTLFKVGVSFGILFYLFRQAVADDQFAQLKSANVNFWRIGLGFACTFSAILTGLYRWRMFVRTLGLPFHYRDAVRIGLIGQFFSLFAFGIMGGDALRSFYLIQQYQFPKSEAIASVIADRLVGVLTMFAIGAIAFQFIDAEKLAIDHPQANSYFQAVGWVVTIAIATAIGSVISLFFLPQLYQQRWLQKLLAVRWVGQFLHRTIAVALAYRNRSDVLLWGCLLSAITNLFFCLAIYLIAGGISNSIPGLLEHLLIEPIVMISNAAPLPGGMGGMEFAMTLMYRLFGNDNGIVVAFAFRLSLLMVAATGGLMWMINRRQIAGLLKTDQALSDATLASPLDKTQSARIRQQ